MISSQHVCNHNHLLDLTARDITDGQIATINGARTNKHWWIRRINPYRCRQNSLSITAGTVSSHWRDQRHSHNFIYRRELVASSFGSGYITVTGQTQSPTADQVAGYIACQSLCDRAKLICCRQAAADDL